VIGLIGILLRRFDWSRPAFLIGFVLSRQVENYTLQAHQIAASKFRLGMDVGLEYIFSPIVIVLIVITAISIYIGIRQAKMIQSEGAVPIGKKRAPMTFLIFVSIYFIISFFDAYAITLQTDRIFPLSVSSVAILSCAILILRMVRADESDLAFADREAGSDDAKANYGLWQTLAWFAMLLILSSLTGFIIALMIFLVVFFRKRARCGWPQTLLLSACGIGLMCFMAYMLNRDFPPGLLQEFVHLPWPFGGI
jgi:putative tricarboxylic transport membrane protein